MFDELHAVDLDVFQDRHMARGFPLEDDRAVQHGQDPDRLAVYSCVEPGPDAKSGLPQSLHELITAVRRLSRRDAAQLLASLTQRAAGPDTAAHVALFRFQAADGGAARGARTRLPAPDRETPRRERRPAAGAPVLTNLQASRAFRQRCIASGLLSSEPSAATLVWVADLVYETLR